MEYEWDPAKAKANLVAFEDIADFDWDTSIIKVDDRFPYGERRFGASGMVNGRLHIVIYTRRDERVRLISLRKANDREVREHGKEKA